MTDSDTVDADQLGPAPDDVRQVAQAAIDAVQTSRPAGLSWASIEVAEAIMGARPLRHAHVRAMATHPYDDDTVSAQLFGGTPGRAWARQVIVADQHAQIAALVAAEVAAGVDAAPRSPLRQLSERLSKIDQRFRARVEAVLSQAMRKAERHARTKAGVRARRLTGAQRASIADDMDAGRLTPGVLAALGVTDEELLSRQFEDAGDQIAASFRERQRARRRALAQLLADEGLTEADLERMWQPTEDSRAEALAAFVAIALFLEARSRLNSGLQGRDLYDPRGEIPFDTAVPGSVLQSVLKVADGATVSPAGTVDPTQPSSPGQSTHPLADQTDDLVTDAVARYTQTAPPGMTLADTLDADAAATALGDDAGGGGLPPSGAWPTAAGVALRYTWQVGMPERPFDPHQALGGLTFTPDEYWTVLAKDPEEWPYGTVAWQPGDHPGCQCWLDIEYGSP